MNAQTRREIMERLKNERPEPESELDHKNPFELLIAVMLSAQATDKSVNLATPGLFAAMPDAATMAGKTPEEVETYIKTIGLYRNKAKHAVGIAKALMERFGGQVPDDLEELVSLPGVGRKTAKDRNGQGGAERSLRQALHSRGHPHFPRVRPHEPGEGQNGRRVQRQA